MFGTTVILHADILLIAPSVSVLPKLLLACEKDLMLLIWLLMWKSRAVYVRNPGTKCRNNNMWWRWPPVSKWGSLFGFLLLVMFPLDALQITPNVAFIVRRMQFLLRLVALPQRRRYWSWLLKMFTNPYFRCVHCVKSIAVSWLYS